MSESVRAGAGPTGGGRTPPAGAGSSIEVAGLWRYPVKSLRGESLVAATLTEDGVAGDRLVHVTSPRGVLTGRTRNGLLTVPAHTDEDGEITIACHPSDSPEELPPRH